MKFTDLSDTSQASDAGVDQRDCSSMCPPNCEFRGLRHGHTSSGVWAVMMPGNTMIRVEVVADDPKE